MEQPCRRTDFRSQRKLLLRTGTLSMAEDIDSSISYLRALKQSSGPHNGTAAAPAHVASPQNHLWPEGTGTDANSSDRFPGPEKRRSTRYRCEGSAGMREDGADVQTWARFTDISLHGCYVEAQATYPVAWKSFRPSQPANYRIRCPRLPITRPHYRHSRSSSTAAKC